MPAKIELGAWLPLQESVFREGNIFNYFAQGVLLVVFYLLKQQLDRLASSFL